MYKLIPKSFREVLKNRDFFLLTLVIFLGQVTSAFLVLSLIVSVFSRTGSNFGVSGVILSFTVPALFLVAFAGIAADIFDRRKIMLFSNIFISAVVLAILMTERMAYASISLSFLYFAGNSFFIPASSAATAQLVKKEHLLVANSIFITILAAGLISGFFVGAVVNFFFGNSILLWMCEILLVLAAILTIFLPKLSPIANSTHAFDKSISSIKEGLVYMFSEKSVWFYFLFFSGFQGVILFGVTIAPGFFDQIIGININSSPILIFPFIGFGVLLGLYIIGRFKLSEMNLIRFGLFVMGITLIFMAFFIKFAAFSFSFLIIITILFLILLGFGTIMILIASRTGIQKKVIHSHQGTIFGANILLTSIFTVFMSPFAAVLEIIFGYLGIFVLGGVGLILLSMAVSRVKV